MGELIERGNNRLSLDNYALAERYLNGKLRIVVDLTCSRCGADAENLRAIFPRKLPVLGVDVNDGDVWGLSVPPRCRHISALNAEKFNPTLR